MPARGQNGWSDDINASSGLNYPPGVCRLNGEVDYYLLCGAESSEASLIDARGLRSVNRINFGITVAVFDRLLECLEGRSS